MENMYTTEASNAANPHARKGILLAGGSGTRLWPSTIALSKQLMPVYDKPMVYYPLSVLMLAHIREVLIISTPHDLPLFKRLLGTGQQWGMQFTYAEQPSPDGLAQAYTIAEDFLDGHPSMLILGDNVFYGEKLSDTLKTASARESGATIFGYAVQEPSAYGVLELGQGKQVIGIEEKPAAPKSNYAVPGIYFYDGDAPAYAKALKPSARGELEITDLSLKYLEAGTLHAELLGRGTAWLDTGTHNDLLDAANFVQIIEKRQGYKIACLEEIAWRNGWIDLAALKTAASQSKSSYHTYLHKLANSAH